MWPRVVLIYLLTMGLTAVPGLMIVVWLVGPHGGVLPDQFRSIVLALFWVAVLGFPVVAARRTYRRNRARTSISE